MVDVRYNDKALTELDSEAASLPGTVGLPYSETFRIYDLDTINDLIVLLNAAKDLLIAKGA